MYLKCNSNLLYHGCIPMEEDRSFTKVTVYGVEYNGKGFIDKLERLAREGYFYKINQQEKLYTIDNMWYLRNGPNSPLFGKRRWPSLKLT
ncbi:MAG: fructose-bisphosphatase class III [Bacillota bacterium]